MYVPAAGYGGARASPLSDTPASEKETYMHEQEQIPWMPLASIFIAPNLKNHYRRGEHQRHGPAARSLLVVFTGLDRARVPNVQPSALTPALHSAAAQCAWPCLFFNSLAYHTFSEKRIFNAWSTKRSLFAKPFHGWV